MRIPVALTIAGVDPDAGAGIYADIKTFSSLGVYGIGCASALTAQNTTSFSSYITPSKGFFKEQLDVLLSDIKPLSLKTGMIPRTWMVDIIVDTIAKYNLKNLVVDPVMVSKTGGNLTSQEVIRKIKRKLFPLSLLITPNIPEAEYLSGQRIYDEKTMICACRKISKETSVRNILLKGGHLKGESIVDILYLGGEVIRFKHKRIKTKNTHGTGCTLSSAITAFLAKGYKLYDAVKKGCDYVYLALSKAIDLGKGNGPLNHFHPYLKRE